VKGAVVFVVGPVKLLVGLNELAHLLHGLFRVSDGLFLLHLFFKLKLLILNFAVFEVVVWRHIEPRVL